MMTTFWTIWSGQALSLAGSQASQFALIWWLTVETGSPAMLSAATLFALLPAVALGPAIGALVDRCSRRVTMVAADGAAALGSLALAALFISGNASSSAVLVFLLWRAVAGAFHGPAMMSATSLMVPGEHLARIQGVNQMLQGGLGILTAPLGAMLLGLIGIAGVMAVDVITALFAILPFLFVKVPEPERHAEPGAAGRGAILQGVAAGLRYLRGLPSHLALIGCASAINLFLVPAFALLPLLALQELGGDAGTQASLVAAFGAGAIGGGLALGIGGGSGSRTRLALASIVGLGAATLALGLVPPTLLPMAVVAMVGVGLCSAVANGCIVAILQTTIAPEYQGRVFSMTMSLAAAMTPIGLLLAAPLADMAGVRAWYVAGGIACTAMGAAALLTPSIVQIETRAEADRLAAASPMHGGGWL